MQSGFNVYEKKEFIYQTCHPATTESKLQRKKLDKLGIFGGFVRLPMTTPLVLAN